MGNHRNIILLLFFQLMVCQTILTGYVVENGDTLDVFAYQVPDSYTGNDPVPLLVAFHQWGGSENSVFFTQFDEQANDRGWLFLSPYGGAANNYNHQGAQYFTQQAILWMKDHYNVDSQRIYMVGGSMGGAAGAIYANNHLDPGFPMVAATASGSGILDCERRFYEMDGNNSMIQWFGGTPEEVPFEYHRNSAVYFADTTRSMHFNLQHVPLYLDFGATEPHRYHAEDLYNLLLGYNPDMWIETQPGPGHGYSVMDATHACEWLSQFTLNSDPDDVNVNLDEPSRAYWCRVLNRIEPESFIRVQAHRQDERHYQILQFENGDSLQIIHSQWPGNGMMTYQISVDHPFILGLKFPHFDTVTEVLLDGEPVSDWIAEPTIVWINIQTPGLWEVVFESSLPDVNADGNVNVLDIVLTVNFIMGNDQPTPEQFNTADMNHDGNVDVLDVVLMVNYIMAG